MENETCIQKKILQEEYSTQIIEKDSEIHSLKSQILTLETELQHLSQMKQEVHKYEEVYQVG